MISRSLLSFSFSLFRYYVNNKNHFPTNYYSLIGKLLIGYLDKNSKYRDDSSDDDESD